MIIDGFMFFNELNILEGRLQYLYDKVDKFVIVESNITHSGNMKPFNFLENSERFTPYLDKIIYRTFSPDPSKYDFTQKPLGFDNNSDFWKLENDQRNEIASAIKQFPDEAFVMISDADEVPSRDAIDMVTAGMSPYGVQAATLRQDMFYFNLRQKEIEQWCGTVLTYNRFVQEMTPQWFRTNRFTLPSVNNAGWHLSYWGTPESIQTKISNFAHQEYNNPTFTDIDRIKQKVAEGKDLYGRDMNFATVDPTTLPKDFMDCFGRFEVNV